MASKKISRREFIMTLMGASTVGVWSALKKNPSFSLLMKDFSGNLPFRPQGLSLYPPENFESSSYEKTETQYTKPMKKFPESEINKIVYFYPWYLKEWDDKSKSYIFHHWRDGYELEPLIGIYDSRDPKVIEWQLTNACTVNAIYAISYFRRGKPEEKVVKDCILKSKLIDDVQFCLHIETHDLLGIDKQKLNLTENTLGLTLSSNQRKKIEEEFSYLSKEYFGHQSYFKINNMNLVFVYQADGFFDPLMKDVKVLAKNLKKIVEENGKEVFLVGEVDFWTSPKGWQKYLMGAWDGITTYTMYNQDAVMLYEKNFEKAFHTRCELYREEAKKGGKLFIPNVTAGFKVKGKAELPRDVSLFKKRMDYTLDLIDEREPTVTITSYNEYKENSVTEPTKQDGYRYWNLIGLFGTEEWF